MKKITKSIDTVNDNMSEYRLPPIPKTSHPEVKDFTYKYFKRIADKAPFTLSEWAEILHLSERTLHRYAKDNNAFHGLQIELILLTEKLIDMGNALFGKEGLKNWVHSPVFSLGNRKPIDHMQSYAGIQEVIQLIGRLQYGISA